MAEGRKNTGKQEATENGPTLGPAAQALLDLAKKDPENRYFPPPEVLAWIEAKNTGPIHTAANPRISARASHGEDDGFSRTECHLSGHRFQVRRGAAVPVLLVDPPAEEVDPWVYDLYPGVLTHGQEGLQKALRESITWKLEEAWALLYDAAVLATLLGQDIPGGWPDCWPTKNGKFTNVFASEG